MSKFTTISIHALRVEGDTGRNGGDAYFSISIHALRVEGDITGLLWVFAVSISIHALRVEGDRYAMRVSIMVYAFLSTPSGWRATL